MRTLLLSPTIAKIELHRSVIKDDVAKMEKQESITILPGATVEFKHGDYHLMLMELTSQLEPGQTVDIILSTSVGDMMIEMPVQKMNMEKMSMDMKSNKHSPDKTDSEQALQTDAKMENNHQIKMEGDEQVSAK